MAATKRNYGDSCGIARALDVVGERWAILVVRELVPGPKRFTDLRAGLPGVSADMLSQRLRELEAAGVVARRTLPPPAAARVYELTDHGRELEPALHALGRWGSRLTLAADPPPLSADAAVVALQTMFEPPGQSTSHDVLELRLGDRPFALRQTGTGLSARQGEGDRPVATIATDPGTLASVLWHARPLTSALEDGSVRITGDVKAARRLLDSCTATTAHA
jgi:DNA-binding HxlR family transcriptional regulator